jgi:hypothetical protein
MPPKKIVFGNVIPKNPRCKNYYSKKGKEFKMILVIQKSSYQNTLFLCAKNDDPPKLSYQNTLFLCAKNDDPPKLSYQNTLFLCAKNDDPPKSSYQNTLFLCAKNDDPPKKIIIYSTEEETPKYIIEISKMIIATGNTIRTMGDGLIGIGNAIIVPYNPITSAKIIVVDVVVISGSVIIAIADVLGQMLIASGYAFCSGTIEISKMMFWSFVNVLLQLILGIIQIIKPF